MNAPDTSLRGLAAANEVRTSSPRPSGADQACCAGWPLAASDWLGLAAAPAFAVMAVLTAVSSGGTPDFLCVAARDASPLSGMVPMYLLMSAFHSASWLRLLAMRRNGA